VASVRNIAHHHLHIAPSWVPDRRAIVARSSAQRNGFTKKFILVAKLKAWAEANAELFEASRQLAKIKRKRTP
jgi:hypothetical protein